MASDKPQVFLEADDEIRGQSFACLSFLTPNRGLLRNKDLFFFSKFLEFYALDYKIRATESFVLGQLKDIQNVVSDIELTLTNETLDASGNKELVERLSKIRGNLSRKTGADLEAHVKDNLAAFKESDIVESYEKYMLVNRQKLEDEFHKANNFQTTMHGLKVRGVYATNDQAVARAKALNKKDPYFNVYVAEVGQWLPWDPSPEDVPEQEYANENLNKLMQAYKDNAAKKDAFFEEEKRLKMEAAAAAVKASKDAKAAAASSLLDAVPAQEAGAGLFDGPGDLAIQRKAEAAVVAEFREAVEKISHA
jgi:hypothetical protein